MNPSTCGHVYVVDDNPDIRFYLTDLLRQMGYSIEGYDSAQAFLQQSIDIFPAVLVLDVRMPGMSGVDLQEKMRSLGRHTPIIFVTAFADEAQTAEGYALGADGALTTAHYQLCSRPANTDAHMSNLLLLMAQRMGVEADQFGDSNQVITI